MEHLCRTCLTKGSISIYEECIDAHVLHEVLSAITGLEIKKEDGLPALVCHECKEKAKIAFDFKTGCLEAEATLKEMMKSGNIPHLESTTKIEKKCKTEPEFESDLKHDDMGIGENSEADNSEDQVHCNICCYVFESETAFKSHLKEKCVKVKIEDENTFSDKFSVVPEKHTTHYPVSSQPKKRWRPRKNYLCDTAVFASAKTAARHKKMCPTREQNYNCHICNLKFAFEISLNKHILSSHPGECVSIKFIDPKLKMVEKEFQCDLCNQCFVRKDLLEDHTAIHLENNVRYLECDVCQRKFNRKDNLKSHMRVHQPPSEREERPKSFLCTFCGRGFSNSSNHIVHMRRHTGEKPYKCDFCGKGFPRSSDLTCHRRSHTGEKPCPCPICGKAFSRSNKLTRHMRVHTGQKPYKCTYCDKAFSQSNDLTLHIRRHTGDKPYVCEICGDNFIQGTALQNHRRTLGHFPTTSSENVVKAWPRNNSS